MNGKLRKILSLVLTASLLFQQVGFAQIATELNIASHLSRMASNIMVERFRPAQLRYFSYDNLNDNFKVFLDKGDLKSLGDKELQSSTKTLLNYFLVGISLPDSMFWVNLRPDSEDQIIDQYLEKTDIGKIMLEADLQLKKDTAQMTSPATLEGKEYWNKLYKKAAELYGYDNVSIPTLTRPWIVPGEIIIRESKDSAYVYKANLKVMLEQDYLKDSSTYNFKDERSKALNEYSSELIRELIIPKLTREINSSKRYASLRQVYYSLILSRWFKLRFSGKAGTYASLINTRNLNNLTSQESWSKTGYFKQYQKSFSEGEYNVKEPVYTPTGQVIRSYFSGGIQMASSAININNGLLNNKDLSSSILSKSGVVMQGVAGDLLSLQLNKEEEISTSSPISNAQKRIKELEDSITERNDRIGQISADIRANNSQMEALRGSPRYLSNSTQIQASALNEIRDLKQQNQSNSEAISRIYTHISEMESELRQLKSKTKKSSSPVSNVQSRIKELQAAIDRSNQAIDRISENNFYKSEEKSEAIAKILTNISRMQIELDRLSRKVEQSSLSVSTDPLKAQIDSKKQELDRLKSKLSDLERTHTGALSRSTLPESTDLFAYDHYRGISLRTEKSIESLKRDIAKIEGDLKQLESKTKKSSSPIDANEQLANDLKELGLNKEFINKIVSDKSSKFTIDKPNLFYGVEILQNDTFDELIMKMAGSKESLEYNTTIIKVRIYDKGADYLQVVEMPNWGPLKNALAIMEILNKDVSISPIQQAAERKEQKPDIAVRLPVQVQNNKKSLEILLNEANSDILIILKGIDRLYSAFTSELESQLPNLINSTVRNKLLLTLGLNPYKLLSSQAVIEDLSLGGLDQAIAKTTVLQNFFKDKFDRLSKFSSDNKAYIDNLQSTQRAIFKDVSSTVKISYEKSVRIKQSLEAFKTTASSPVISFEALKNIEQEYKNWFISQEDRTNSKELVVDIGTRLNKAVADIDSEIKVIFGDQIIPSNVVRLVNKMKEVSGDFNRHAGYYSPKLYSSSSKLYLSWMDNEIGSMSSIRIALANELNRLAGSASSPVEIKNTKSELEEVNKKIKILEEQLFKLREINAEDDKKIALKREEIKDLKKHKSIRMPGEMFYAEQGLQKLIIDNLKIYNAIKSTSESLLDLEKTAAKLSLSLTEEADKFNARLAQGLNDSGLDFDFVSGLLSGQQLNTELWGGKGQIVKESPLNLEIGSTAFNSFKITGNAQKGNRDKPFFHISIFSSGNNQNISIMVRDNYEENKGPISVSIRGIEAGALVDDRAAEKIISALKGIASSASSPVDQEIALYISKLSQERFEERIRAQYSKVKSEVETADPYLAKIGFDGKESRLGWSEANLDWILANPNSIEQILKDAEFIRSNFKYVVFCGMGGSGLSVQVVKDTFGEKQVKLYSLRTTDPQVIKDILDDITKSEGSLETGLGKTLVIPISKSGTTQETVTHKKYFEDLFKQVSLDSKKHIWVVTDKGSPMDTGDYTQREIQLNGRGDIGGRFTAPTTNVFLLPLAIAAPDKVIDMLKTAKQMNDIKDIDKDTFLKLGAYLYYMSAKLGKDKITMFMPDELKDIPLWAEQLFEESLGKEGKGVTLFYGENLSEKELKPVKDNDRVFFRINLDKNKTNQELWDYLIRNGYPTFELNVKDIYSIGGIMLGFQRTVAAIAYLWDITFVDQPAVEGYKKGTREVMQSIKPGESVKAPLVWKYSSFKSLKLYYSPIIEAGIMTEDDIRKEVNRLGFDINNASAVYAAIINILKSKKEFQALEIMSYGRMTRGLKDVLENARYNIFTKTLKMPSKLGEGPDKNHSFHQNIDAGKDMWLSTYFMANQIEQPKALEFDSNLLKAQAIGTVKSLASNKRAAVLITFEGKTKNSEADTKEFFAKVSDILSLFSANSALTQEELGSLFEAQKRGEWQVIQERQVDLQRTLLKNYEQQWQTYSEQHALIKPIFDIVNPDKQSRTITPAEADEYNLKGHFSEFTKKSDASTAGIRAFIDLLHSENPTKMYNDMFVAMLIEAEAEFLKDVHSELSANLPRSKEEIAAFATKLRTEIDPNVVKVIEEIYNMPLEGIIPFLRDNVVKLVGGEVRVHTGKFVEMESRILASKGIKVITLENFSDSVPIYMYSFLTYLLGTCGATHYTSSHSANYLYGRKSLAPDGAQLLPDVYENYRKTLKRIIEDDIYKKGGYTVDLSAQDTANIISRLSYSRMAKLYRSILNITQKEIDLINEATTRGHRIVLNALNGSTWKMMKPLFEELGIDSKVFHLVMENENSLFDAGYVVTKSKDGSYSVDHLGIDTTLAKVVQTIPYSKMLEGLPIGTRVYECDPDSDRFVVKQIVADTSDNVKLIQEYAITSYKIGDGKILVAPSPNKAFLVLDIVDHEIMRENGTWDQFWSMYYVTYVSTRAWVEFAESVPGLIRVMAQVGFKNLTALQRSIEDWYFNHPEQNEFTFNDQLGRSVTVSRDKKIRIHSKEEESGGRVSGMNRPAINVLGQKVLAMPEKSAADSLISELIFASRLYLNNDASMDGQYSFLDFMHEAFRRYNLKSKVDIRIDLEHGNQGEIATKPYDEQQKALEQAGIVKTNFNNFFFSLGRAVRERNISIEKAKEVLSAVLPRYKETWEKLTEMTLTEESLAGGKTRPEGVPMIFGEGAMVTEFDFRPSGTDPLKSKIYIDAEQISGSQLKEIEATFSELTNYNLFKVLKNYGISSVSQEPNWLVAGVSLKELIPSEIASSPIQAQNNKEKLSEQEVLRLIGIVEGQEYFPPAGKSVTSLKGIKDKENIAVLKKELLTSTSYYRRKVVAWILGAIGNEYAVDALMEAITTMSFEKGFLFISSRSGVDDRPASTLFWIVTSLGETKSKKAVDLLTRITIFNSVYTRHFPLNYPYNKSVFTSGGSIIAAAREALEKINNTPNVSSAVKALDKAIEIVRAITVPSASDKDIKFLASSYFRPIVEEFRSIRGEDPTPEEANTIYSRHIWPIAKFGEADLSVDFQNRIRNIIKDVLQTGSPVNKASPPLTNASSAIEEKKDVGGIDFRSLPMTIQPMGSFTGLNFKLPQLTQAQLKQINIASEMQQVKNLIESGTVPSGDRIKELIAACAQKGEMGYYADNLLLCLVDICKLQEQNAFETSPELREALAIVDALG